MSNAKSGREKFATSLISLALIRNGYQTQMEVRLGQNSMADLVAMKPTVENEEQEVFAVEVKWVSSLEKGLTSDLMHWRDETSKRIGMPLYMAFVMGDGSSLKVEDELKKRMLFSSEELEVSIF